MAGHNRQSAMPAAEFRAQRERRGLTQVALARKLGVAEITIRKWETGERPISRLAVIALTGLRVPAGAERPRPGRKPTIARGAGRA